MRGMVSEVSATLVARMRRRWLPGLNTRCWSPRPSLANNGSTSVLRYRRPSNTSAQSRISRSPGRNTSTSPRGSISVSISTARATCCGSSSSSTGGRKNSATGNIRPGASITGAGRLSVPKNDANAPASSVAEEMTTLRSGRLSSSRLSQPNRKSMFSERSCASSRMMAAYWRNMGSPCVSASRMPSVMNLMRVSGVSFSSKRTWYPTKPPSGTASSSATRLATLAAAMRRGWVQPIRPPSGPRASATILGSWVVFPDPVSLTTTIT